MRQSRSAINTCPTAYIANINQFHSLYSARLMEILRLTLRQLQIFVAVAHHGSTAAASGRIALSQSATSAAVNELERLLSLRLFDRAGRRLLLNDNGRAILPRALALLDSAAQIEQQGHSDSDQLLSLRIGASTTIGNYVLPGLLGALLAAAKIEQRSAWNSTVAIANTEAIGNAIAGFELDLGFVEGPVHLAEVRSIPWARDEMVVVGAMPQASGERPMTVKSLRDRVWLLRETGSGTREAADQALLPHLRTYRRRIELGSSEAIKHAAILGLGLACLSRWVVNDAVQTGKLQILRTTLPRLYRPCFAILHRSKAITRTMQFALEKFGVKPIRQQ
jgi:DNA-binding transcriptional LysR family regulator